MKERMIEAVIAILFVAVIVMIVASVVSVTWGAYELHGIHHELQVMNDSTNWAI